jgi:TrmH family RNA methyltransferase
VRSEHQRYLVDGPVLLAEALAAGVEVCTVYVEADNDRDAVRHAVQVAADRGVPVRSVAPGALAKVLDLVTPQSVVAVVAQHPSPLDAVLDRAVAAGRPVLAAEDLADPGNLGTLVRSAEATGCAGVVLVGNGADPYNPKVVRASAGAIFRTPTATVGDIDELLAGTEARELRMVGAAGERGTAPEDHDLTGALVLVVGNEAHGLSDRAIDAADRLVSIPMEGWVESLNAAVAGSVLLFEAARQRRAGSPGSPPAEPVGQSAVPVGHDGGPASSPGDASASAPDHGSPPR